MTYSESHPHLNVLNDEKFSGQQLRIVHNVALGIFFLNCTNTVMCKHEFKHLIAVLGSGGDRSVKCTGCDKHYDDHDLNPVFRNEDVGNDFTKPFVKKWVAAWLGVEERYIGITVE